MSTDLQHEALEAALRRDLRDEASWAVYADWLDSQGDLRGELIAFEQRAEAETDRELAQQWRSRAKALFEREHPRWLGPLVKARIEPTWARGFVTELLVHDRPRWTVDTLLSMRTGALTFRVGFVRLPDCRPVAEALAGSWVDVLELRSLDTSRVEPLAVLEGLRELFIERCTIDDLATLAELPALERLVIHRSALDLGAFKRGFASLRHLELSRHESGNAEEVVDLSGLAGLPAVEILDLHDTRIADLGPLARLPKLRQIDVSQTQVESLTPLGQIDTLERVDAIERFDGGIRDDSVEWLRSRGVYVERRSKTSRYER